MKGRWLVTLVGLLVLLASSSALAGSSAAKPRFQNSYVCVNLHDGLIKVISRRQRNRCSVGWKRYKVSDIFGRGMRGAAGAPGPAVALRTPRRTRRLRSRSDLNASGAEFHRRPASRLR